MFKDYIEWAKGILETLGFEDLVKENAEEVDLLLILLMVGVISSGLTALWRGLVWYLHRNRQVKLAKDLHPFFSSADIKQATQYYVPSHFQSNPPSQHQELIHAHQVTAREKLIPFFLNHALKPENDQQRFYIILAGSGMGKTTFMLNLYMAYLRRKQVGKAPFFIRLMPLGYPDLLKRIDQIPNQERTILLLDGLDEDTQAIRNYRRRLERILNRVKDFRFVVFTCRTQFFPSEEEEPRETGVVRFGTKAGFQTFAKLYLAPFDHADIEQYLGKRYGRWNRSRKQKALRIVERSSNLMVRPMLLSYIDDLLEADEGQYQYLSKLYEALISKWIEREAGRIPEDRRERFTQELYRFSREVALNIYQQRRHRKGLYVGLKEIHRLGEKHHLELDDMEMQSRSLLNRNVLDQYKFAHKSILEYFLAREAVENPRFAAQLNFQSMDQARIFYQEMCLLQRTWPLLKDANSGIEVRYAGQLDWQPSYFVEKDQIHRLSGLKTRQVADLTVITALQPLEVLDLSHSEASELQPLQTLSQLYELYLAHTAVQDLSPLESLPQLELLTLDRTAVSDLTPLRKLTELRHLSLAHTAVRQFDVLQSLPKLHHLDLSHTGLKDLSLLKNQRSLESLDLTGCPVSGLNPLRDMHSLRELNLAHTQVKNLNALRHLTQLEKLDLSGIPATNFSALKALSALRELKISLPPDEEDVPLTLREALPACMIEVVPLKAENSKL